MTGSAAEIAAALEARGTFLLTSHARPDGDAIGSSMALALALQQRGKRVRVVLHDPIPAAYADFPAVDHIEHLAAVSDTSDAAVFLECSDPTRPDVAGLERHTAVNIDHHAGNTLYGAFNWYDVSAAACGEMVADVIDALGVAWTPDIAEHLYLAIATDTGSFRYGPVSARTFEICRRVAAAGVDTSALARRIFDSFSIGRVRLTGALLDGMELHADGRLALLSFDDETLTRCGATLDDTEGLVNLPLGARDVVAVALLKPQQPGTFRVSLRSKGAVDVRAIAARWQGGGHVNAAGCTVAGTARHVRDVLVAAMTEAIEQAG